MQLSYDLHIHSCLSPCGDDDMTPFNIVGMASIKGLDVIAVTDHNTCKNCPAIMHHAEKLGILAIPGMELTTSEEVHSLCLFPSLKMAMQFDEYVQSQLLKIPNDEAIFGKQQVMDFNDTIITNEKNLLVSATLISFYDIFDLTKKYGGITIPAHVDKKTNSVISNLGFIPQESKFTTVEIKNKDNLAEVLNSNHYLKICKILHNSDAHLLQDINEPTEKIEVEHKSIESILKFLQF